MPHENVKNLEAFVATRLARAAELSGKERSRFLNAWIVDLQAKQMDVGSGKQYMAGLDLNDIQAAAAKLHAALKAEPHAERVAA